jgi:hypothetical protein
VVTRPVWGAASLSCVSCVGLRGPSGEARAWSSRLFFFSARDPIRRVQRGAFGRETQRPKTMNRGQKTLTVLALIVLFGKEA